MSCEKSSTSGSPGGAVRPPGLLLPVGGLSGLAYAFVTSSESVLVSCAAGTGGCGELDRHFIWTDTLTVALVVAIVLVLATPALWRARVLRGTPRSSGTH